MRASPAIGFIPNPDISLATIVTASTAVPMDSLRRIIEGAGMAPSGHNIQPWKLYVVGGATKDDVIAFFGFQEIVTGTAIE